MAEPTPPGDGFKSPFGNHDGATAEVGAMPDGGTDFTEDITGKGRKVPLQNDKLFPNRAQKMGPSNFNPDSVPAGGRVLMADPNPREKDMTKAIGKGTRKPFKLAGGGGPDSDVEGGGEE